MPLPLNSRFSPLNRKEKGPNSLWNIFMKEVCFLAGVGGVGTFRNYNNYEEESDILKKENENPAWYMHKIEYLNG